jgi:hypothetical protein
MEIEPTPQATIESMAFARRILRLAAASLAFLAYVWFAAVLNAPKVKRRMAARRAARAGGPTAGPPAGPAAG